MRLPSTNLYNQSYIKVACEKESDGSRYVLTEEYRKVKNYFDYKLKNLKKYIVFKKYLL